MQGDQIFLCRLFTIEGRQKATFRKIEFGGVSQWAMFESMYSHCFNSDKTSHFIRLCCAALCGIRAPNCHKVTALMLESF